MLPVKELSNGLSSKEIEILLNFYPIINSWNSHPCFKVKGDPKMIPGIIFDFSLLDDSPVKNMLYDIKRRYPFLNNIVSYIITDDNISSFNLHSHTDSHCHLLTVLESDNTAKTHWYKIKKAPAFLKKSELIGIVPNPEGEVEHWHTASLLQGKTYLFDSHTFHSVENLNKNKRLVFTWWLDHIAYQPAYEYYEQHNYFV